MRIDAYAECRLPSLGLRLETGWSSTHKHMQYYSRYTRMEYVYLAKCQYCGLYILKSTDHKKHKESLHFCSIVHQNRYFGKIRSENALKNAVRLVSNQELKEFQKRYSNFVYSEIYKYSEFQDDLMDWWNFDSIKILANLKRNNGNKTPAVCFNYLKISIKNAFLKIKKERAKEVFYSELSIKKQIQLFGEPIEERI